MKAYSKDLRIRVLDAIDRGLGLAEATAVFGISPATIRRWRQRRRDTGSLAESPRSGPPSVKMAALRIGLLPQLEAQPDATLAQHCRQWEYTTGVLVSTTTMNRVIRGDFGWTRKKSL